MMGGQRTGKSSALAAVMNAFTNGSVREILTAKDVTTLSKAEGEKQQSISSKLKEITTLLKEKSGRTILVNSGKTQTIWHYRLDLSVPGSNNSMHLTFTDVNGEYFEGGTIQQEEILKYVEDYDIFIIAIDTPFLMEAENPDNDLVNEIINDKYNCVDSIHTFLSAINDQEGKNAKLVIFVPIKCEKWAHAGQLDKVSTSVKEVYETSLKHLLACKAVQTEILPIQTAGNIVFDSHREAYCFDWTEKKFLFFQKDRTSRCSFDSSIDSVTLSNGESMPRSVGRLRMDPSAVLIPGTDIVRPNSWFKVLSPQYAPHNCEQLAFHILSFMFSKVMDLKIKSEENRSIFSRIFDTLVDVFTFGLWNKLKDVFGEISISTMQTILHSIREKGLYKDNGEGILVLKTCVFKTPKK